MAVTTKKTFPATSNSTTDTFGPIGIELNNQDDLDVYITLSGGTRVLQYKQTSASTTDSNHPQVNDTTGLYFPPVAAGVALKNYTISADNNNVIFNSALPSGAVVSVERRTRDSSSSYTSFSGGSTIRSTDLNTAFDEARFTAQEGRNKAFDLERQTFSEDGNIRLLEDQSLVYEGATDDAYETTLAITDPTADRTITFPNVSGTVVTTGDTGTVDATMMAADSVNTSELVDDSVTYAKIQNVSATDRILGRDSSGAGVVEEITPAALRTMLNIEDGSTGDQSNAEIRAAVEAASDSNVFTDADHTRLNSVADNANNYSISSDLLDEDNMASNSATKAASQQSIKAYVDANAGGGGTAITIQDEGSALSTAASTINFVGAGVTASGTGTTKTITISGSGGSPITTDYQYLELKAHNNTSGAFSAGSADYELVTKGTTTAVSPDQAAAMLISIAGVLQEPNTGTSIGSNDGFCIDGSSIHFGANLTAHPDYIIWMKGSGSHTIDDDSVTEAKLDIHNAPSGTDKYLKYTSNGMEWATATGGVSDIVDDTSPQLGGALDVQAQEINTSTTNGNIKLTPNGTGVVEVKGNTNPGTIQLNCENNSHGVKIKGPAHSAAASYTLTLPNDDGSANQVLKTDGSGNLAWVAQTTDTNTQLSTEEVQDIVGAMFSGNTETNITATYEDSDGTIDLVSTDTVYTHPNHSGEVTSTADGATVIADNVVDEANLKVSNAPTNGQVLVARSGNTGGMTWEASPAPSFEIFEHANALTANKTIGTNNNALVAGPFSTGSYTLTIPSGSVFTVV